MASINLLNELQKINIEKPDYMLGKGLQMPFAGEFSENYCGVWSKINRGEV